MLAYGKAIILDLKKIIIINEKVNVKKKVKWKSEKVGEKECQNKRQKWNTTRKKNDNNNNKQNNSNNNNKSINK